MKVFPIGTKVKTVMDDIPALITAINIRQNDRVIYEISYFKDRDHKAIFVESIEITSNKKASKIIGFNNDNT